MQSKDRLLSHSPYPTFLMKNFHCEACSQKRSRESDQSMILGEQH